MESVSLWFYGVEFVESFLTKGREAEYEQCEEELSESESEPEEVTAEDFHGSSYLLTGSQIAQYGSAGEIR